MKDSDLMPIGKYKGKPLSEVPDGHLLYLLRQDYIIKYPKLYAYLLFSEDAIVKNINK